VSVPGGGSATTTTPAPTGQPTSGDFRGAGTTVSLSLGDDGDLVSVGAVRRLFEKFNRVIGNGAKIVSN
jgi:lipase chaperone LimK